MRMRTLALAVLVTLFGTAALAAAQPPAPVWTEEGRAAVAAEQAPPAGDELPAPDPVDDPSGAINAVRDAFRSGALVGVVLLLWTVSRVAHRYQDKIGFLGTAKRRALLVGATSVLAALAAALAAGEFDWSMLLGSLGAMIALYLNPEPKPAAGLQ